MPTPDEMRVWAEAEQRVMRQHRSGLRVDQGVLGDAVPVSGPMGGGLSIFRAFFQAYLPGQKVEATLSLEPGAMVIEARGVVRDQAGQSLTIELDHVDVRPRHAVGDWLRVVALGEDGYELVDQYFTTDLIVGGSSESGGSGI